MGTLATALQAKDIHLAMLAGNPADAFEEVIASLRHDPRVEDWDALRLSLLNGSPIDCGPGNSGLIVLHHRRTPSVRSMVLAAGRLIQPPPSPSSAEQDLRMLFVAAIPDSLDNEYLRVLGAVSRICGDEHSFQRLMQAEDEKSFLSVLEEGVRR